MKPRFAPKDIIPETQREWKKRKRAEWRAVMKAANVFLQGAHYTPADQGDVVFYPDILEKLGQVQKKLSAKEWGR